MITLGYRRGFICPPSSYLSKFLGIPARSPRHALSPVQQQLSIANTHLHQTTTSAPRIEFALFLRCYSFFFFFEFQYQMHRVRCAGSIGCVLIPSTRSSPTSILFAKSQRKKSTSTLHTPEPARPSARSAAAMRSTATIDAARMATSSLVASIPSVLLGSSTRASSRRTSEGG